MFFRMSTIIGLLAAIALGAAGADTSYLALGDSIAFGFDPYKLGSPADQFTGYPEVIAASKNAKQLKNLTNLACPGETSGSFYDATAPDNQCRPYKAAFGLHTPYQTTQMTEALFVLQTASDIEAITIDIGGNDLILLQQSCNFDSTCILAGLPDVLTAYGNHLGTILGTLRQQARYRGPIILLSTYSPDYVDPVQAGGILALNSVATTVAALYGVKIADGYTAFALASARYGGKPCAAGLLIKLPDGSCDVHPSPAGRDLLAKTVIAVLNR